MNPGLIWFIVGIVLLILEFALPGVIIGFFGAGSIIVSILCWIGLINDSLTWQMSIFVGSSLLLLLTLRRYLSKYFKGKKFGEDEDSFENKEFIGKKVKVTHKIEPNVATGKIVFEGAEWKAISDEIIEKNEMVEIIEKDNITLKVKKIT